MPRVLVAVLVGAAILVLGTVVPSRPLLELPHLHAHLVIAVSLKF